MTGPLIIIGGHEDKQGEREILTAVADHLAGRNLALATVASQEPAGYLDTYREAFAGLGVGEIVELSVNHRGEASDERVLSSLNDVGGVFFGGGDQLRISSLIGDTPVERRVREIWEAGGLIAGTSAGASVMTETMLVRGTSAETYRIGDIAMAPGLGLLQNVVIDQHFAERGRIGRLLGAIAHNPRMLGVGIDEDTAVIVAGNEMRVIGSGAVYVVDAGASTSSNVADASPDSTLSLHNVLLHLLSRGDTFLLDERAPGPNVAKTR